MWVAIAFFFCYTEIVPKIPQKGFDMMRLFSALYTLPRPCYLVLKTGLYLSLFAAVLSLIAYIALTDQHSYALQKNACDLITAAVQCLLICGSISVFSGIRMTRTP